MRNIQIFVELSIESQADKKLLFLHQTLDSPYNISNQSTKNACFAIAILLGNKSSSTFDNNHIVDIEMVTKIIDDNSLMFMKFLQWGANLALSAFRDMENRLQDATRTGFITRNFVSRCYPSNKNFQTLREGA